MTAGLLSVLKALRLALLLPFSRALRPTLRRPLTVVAIWSFGAGKAEVYLFLEAVHLGDLDFHFVAEAERAAIAATGQRATCFVEFVKIVREAGAVDQPAHRKARHVHKETEVAHVGHQRGIYRRVRHLQLRFQERIHLHVLAVALSVGGIAFGVGDMFRGFLERMRRAVARLKERTVDDEVGVAADGRGEVRVFGLGQPVMPKRFDGVTGAHE